MEKIEYETIIKAARGAARNLIYCGITICAENIQLLYFSDEAKIFPRCDYYLL